jgi:hypothetical protein
VRNGSFKTFNGITSFDILTLGSSKTFILFLQKLFYFNITTCWIFSWNSSVLLT